MTTRTTYTAAEKLHELLKPRELNKVAVLKQLPPDMPVSVMSNCRPLGPLNPHNIKKSLLAHAWLSYDDGYDGVAILRDLDEDGWRASPCTLAKFGYFRECVQPYTLDTIADNYKSLGGDYRLNEAEIIAPFWVTSNTYCTGGYFRCFMERDGVRLFMVFRMGAAGASVNGNRVEYRGGWHLERPSFNFPKHWYAIEGHFGEDIAHLASPRIRVDSTRKSISGELYWHPVTVAASEEWPLTADQALAQLIQPKQSA